MNRGDLWPRVSVADVCSSIVDCVNKTAPLADSPTPFKMIRTTNVRNGWVNLNDLRCVERSTYEQWTRRQEPKRGDVILTREAPLGEVGMLRSDEQVFLGQRLVAYRADPAKLDNRFLLYAMLGDDMQGQIRSLGSGATVQHMRVPDCEKLTLRLPPLPVQRRIASILSAYDDLIENNMRRIAILEEMAQRIYEEWFIRFRFPGHQNVRMVESALGPVPEGWNVTTLGASCAYINRGLAPKYDDSAPGIVINQKCIRGQRLSLSEARRQSKPVPKEKLVMIGDVLINSTGVGTLGRVAQVLEPLVSCTVDTHVSIVRPSNGVDHDFFGLALLSKQSHFEAQGVGSTGQTELSRGRIADTGILLPPKALQEQFGHLARPMRQLGVKLQAKNDNLRMSRDLLLPKLVSGELDVSALPEQEAIAA